MIIIAGLGNPGEKYERTRHNVGFMVIDSFAKKMNFPDFRISNKFAGNISESRLGNERVFLLKPQLFMNNSGKSISSLLNYRRKENKELVVIHDDIDLPLGKIRIVKNRGAAGHKGVESIIRSLGGKDFIRIRIGINSRNEEFTHRKAEEFVLRNFTRKEDKIIKELSRRIDEAIKLIMDGELEKAMSVHNR